MSLEDRIDGVIDAALGSRIVGCTVLVSSGGERVYARAAGYADREAGRSAHLDTIYRLASVTKPIVAATALKMVDKGLLSLDDKVADYLPYFTPAAPDGSTPDITIRQLLTHTSGLTYNLPTDVSRGLDGGFSMTLDENIRRYARQPLAFAPGTAWAYGLSIDVLGAVLEVVGRGARLGEVIALHTTGPLGMRDTRFNVTDRHRLAVAYADGTPEPVRMAEPQAMQNRDGSVEYWSPERIFHPTAPQSGGAGMAGTAGDFLTLLDAVLRDFLSPSTRDEAFSIGTGDLPLDATNPGQGFGLLGAVIRDTEASGWARSGLVHWGGAWGNSWVLDPASGTSVVAFTNTAKEGCNGAFRNEISDAVFG